MNPNPSANQKTGSADGSKEAETKPSSAASKPAKEGLLSSIIKAATGASKPSGGASAAPKAAESKQSATPGAEASKPAPAASKPAVDNSSKSSSSSPPSETSPKYDASSIQVLEGLEAVRKRPAMYIGDTGARGLHHCVYEVVDNAIDEALAGFCKEIVVAIHSDGSVSVMDDGRGIPVEKHATGKSALEVVMTVLHAGGKFDKKSYKVSGGLHGVGVSCVNALSDWMEVFVHRDGKEYKQRYERGKPVTAVIEMGAIGSTKSSSAASASSASSSSAPISFSSPHGTLVRFHPDSQIFETIEFEYDVLLNRLRELAYLNRGIRITLSDERSKQSETLHYSGGIIEFVSHLNKNKNSLHPVIYFEKDFDHSQAEVALQYNDGYSENLFSYVNSIHTLEGGTHVVGFRAALTRTINNYAKENKLLKDKDSSISSEDLREGLSAVISLRIPAPQFEGQTKTKLGNSEVKGFMESLCGDALRTYFEEHPADARMAVAKALNAMAAREAAQKAKDLIRRKGALESAVLPGKLADCSDENPENCEIYIVEGDSAGGSAKQGRDRKTQAILPLRGKILNVEKAPIHKLLESAEIRNLIMAFGTNFGSDFDRSKLRYHKIIIMTDADVDGAHIRTLLLTLFYRHMRELVERGHIYIAQPPLYKVKAGNKEAYAYTDADLAKLLASWGNPKNYHSQRYKGLGEMNPKQLWETTMDPATRSLLQVTVEDAMKADELFTILMGDAVEPRRQYIEKYAKEAKNIDV
ncbi:MAG: DNA topoisomerase (ATP-hydrolyzing) subunit B [Candidatus Marsarchaeota archaeon]|nr:DNA topoisomerase (ATP-hydrolyzing) subunit B [Candidatus Marsarchaeota archaeon]